MDFTSPKARIAPAIARRFDELGSLGPQDVGGKAWRLALLRKAGFSVPPGYCIPHSALQEHLKEAGVLPEIEGICHSVAANRGYSLIDRSNQVRRLVESPYVQERLTSVLAQSVAEIRSEWGTGPIIVRSSAVSEDSRRSSHAGVFTSVLCLEGPDGLARAVTRCWTSAYSPRVWVYRQARRLPLHEVGMSILIQPHLSDTELSGVLFTCNPLTGDQSEFHVSGASGGGQTVAGFPSSLEMALPRYGPISPQTSALLHDLRTLGLAVEQALGDGTVDIEWGYDGRQIHLFQARPTLGPNDSLADQCTFKAASVDDQQAVQQIPLGDVAFLYENWLRKRLPIRSLAAETGEVGIPRCQVVRYNQQGLAKLKSTELTELMDARTPHVILEVSRSMRGLVLPVADVLHYLEGLPGDSEPTTIMIRECFVGLPVSQSALSCQVGEDILVEFAVGSIAGLKSGMSSVSRAILRPTGELLSLESRTQDAAVLFNFSSLSNELRSGAYDNRPLLRCLAVVARFTAEAHKQFRNPKIEWWMDEETAYLLDWSWEESSTASLTGERLSPGIAAGWALVVNEDEDDLFYLSEGNAVSVRETEGITMELAVIRRLHAALGALPPGPVILVARFPLTIFSILLEDRVRGMVFESGPRLCHLGILLRESGVASVFVNDATTSLQTGNWIQITEEGEITCAEHR